MNRRITDRVNHALRIHRLPGLAVAVRQDDRERFAAGFGHIDPAGSRPVSADTPFGVASLSKFVTASLIMWLHERGRLSLDDPLSRYYPSLAFASDGSVRLHHLLSHSAGLPGLPCRYLARDIEDIDDRSGGAGRTGPAAAAGLRTDVPSAGIVSAAELVDLINRLEFEPLAPPGALLSYSNEGYCLLGGIIGQLTRCSFAQAVRDQVFGPLQMNRSFVGNEGLPASGELALPLLRAGDGYRSGRFWQAPLFYSAGGLISSARDIARLIQSLGDRSALLTAESRRQMMRPHMPVPSRPGSGTAYGFGLEWHRVDSKTTIAWHSGQRTGVSSFMAWLVEGRLAISLLCHVAGAPVAAIGHALLGDLLGRPDIQWPPPGPVRDGPAAPDHAFAGRYGSDEVGTYVVEPTANALVLKGPLIAEPMVLRFDTPDSGIVGDQTFRFIGDDPASSPWALALDLRMLRRYPGGDHAMSGSSG